MPPTLFQRLAIVVLGSTALVADTLWMLQTGSHAAAGKKIEVPNSVIEQRFADFGAGPMVGQAGSEGDLARAGYIWALERRPAAEINCPNHVPAFQRGCIKWLADMRDIDPDWSGEVPPR